MADSSKWVKQNIKKKIKTMSCSALIRAVKKEWFSSQCVRISWKIEHDKIHSALAWGCSLAIEYLLRRCKALGLNLPTQPKFVHDRIKILILELEKSLGVLTLLVI